MKITFMGAGSTVFSKNVIGDSMLTECLRDSEFALYDINPDRLEESRLMLEQINSNINQGRARIIPYLGTENRKKALKGASFVINAIQAGGYSPCTITDFEIPKKYGLRQTIGDTLGIGGIFRALRTIPVMEDFARDMAEACPDAWLLNYTNPMAMLSGFMQRYTPIKTVGLCHSVQVCAPGLLSSLGFNDTNGYKEKIAGINHMAWLLDIRDSEGNDLYPEIRRRARERLNDRFNNNADVWDLVRLEYINRLGYYCTESSEHNAEYNMFFIKAKYPELIDKYRIPLDEYIRRCIYQIDEWEQKKHDYIGNKELTHERTHEYASYIMEAMLLNKPYKIGGNVINKGGLIENLPYDACVEVPCLVDGTGVNPVHVGALPVQLAAMNMTNINVQLITIEAAVTRKKEHIYHAAMLDPHTASELSIDHIVAMCDDLIQAHGNWLPKFN